MKQLSREEMELLYRFLSFLEIEGLDIYWPPEWEDPYVEIVKLFAEKEAQP